jgi:hypothetical protein
MSLARSSFAPILRIFTPVYATNLNAMLVRPASSILIKPNELSSALARPMQVIAYAEEQASPAYLAGTLAFGVIKGTFRPVVRCFVNVNNLLWSHY